MTNKEIEQIYNESYKAVYWTAMALLKNEADAEDVVQDTFISFIESYGQITDTSKAAALLKKIAANKCLDRIKLARTDAFENEFFDDVEALPEDFLPDTLIESEEMRKVIMNIIDNVLSDDIKRTLVLFYFDEMSTKEIADALGVPQGTVLWRLNFAKKRIKKEVEKYEEENKTKLFGMVALPFITKLFIKESGQVAFKPMPANLINLSASAQAQGSGAANNAASAAVKGSGLMKKIIIACVAAAAAITMTVGIAVLIKNKPDAGKTGTRIEDSGTSRKNKRYMPVGDDENDRDGNEDEDDGEYVPETYPTDPESAYRIITFGKYRDNDIEWLVLDENENGMFLLSRIALDSRQYNEKNTKITWEKCTLRKWLNSEFYDAAFNSEEKSRIIKTTVKNPDNPKHGSNGGNDTEDYVYLLSYQEARKYFCRTKDIVARYAGYMNSKNTQNLSEKYGYTAWWLRTPGYTNEWVTAVGYIGPLSDTGNSPETTMGIRPVIWLSNKPLKDGETPAPTAAPEQLAKLDVKVEDAFREEIYKDDEPVLNHYPKVTIPGVETTQINRKMKNDLKRKSGSGERSHYEYYISDNYVSIAAALIKDDKVSEYKVYNISKATGREVDGRRILEEYGMSQEAFLNRVKKIYGKIGAGSEDAPSDMKKQITRANHDREKFTMLIPFYAKNGHLCFAGYISSYENDDKYYLFDATESYHYKYYIE